MCPAGVSAREKTNIFCCHPLTSHNLRYEGWLDLPGLYLLPVYHLEERLALDLLLLPLVAQPLAGVLGQQLGDTMQWYVTL